MSQTSASGGGTVRAAEVIAALSLATDLQLALDFEHGLRSTVLAMRIGERLGADCQTLSETYHACLLMYAGCTADVHVRAEVFDDLEAASRALFPAMFGSSREMLGALARSVAPGPAAPLDRPRLQCRNPGKCLRFPGLRTR